MAKKDEEIREEEKTAAPTPDAPTPDAPEAETPETETPAGGETETSNEGGGEEASQSDWKERMKQRAKAYFQDKEFESDDEMGAAAEEMVDDLINYKEEGEEASRKLAAIFESEPAVADFMADLMEGASVPVAIARNIDVESIQPEEGDPDYEAWKEAKEKREQKIQEQKDFENEISANKVESSKNFKAFAEEKGMSEEDEDAFLETVDAFLDDIYRGRVSKNFLDAMYKATGYEKDIENAKKEAEVKTRNEKVEAKKTEYKNKKGDGLPKVNSTGSEPEQPKKPKPRFARSLDKIEEREKRRI